MASPKRRRDTILEAVERFRQAHPATTIIQLAAFLYVCENEGLNVSELAVALNSTRATASRVARSLADSSARGSLHPGLGLIVSGPNEADQRGRILRLTEQGQALRAGYEALIRERRPIGQSTG